MKRARDRNVIVASLLKVLATSREPLKVTGERNFPVLPLGMPEASGEVEAPVTEVLERSEAVQLFVERAQAVRPDFSLTADNAAAVAEICRLLDGLPLAIELAVPWINILSPQEVLKQLPKPSSMASRGPRDRDLRQQTLDGAFAWSYSLLNPVEQALFRRLAVFAGGCTLMAAMAVCAAAGVAATEVLLGIMSLVEKSLIRSGKQADGEARFMMLNTLQEYAISRLADSGEAESTHQRHATFFLDLAEQAAPELAGPKQAAWLQRLDVEHDNLRQALRWLVERRDGHEAMRLAAALGRFWWSHGDYDEGLAQLNEVLALPVTEGSTSRVSALNAAGMLAIRLGRLAAAHAAFKESVEICTASADRSGIAEARGNIALAYMEQCAFDDALPLLDESLSTYRELGDQGGIADALDNMGVVATAHGDYAAAKRLLLESLATYAGVGNIQGAGWVRNDLARVALAEGDYNAAQVLAIEALHASESVQDKQIAAWAHMYLGIVAAGRGDTDVARAYHEKSVNFFILARDRRSIALTLESYAGLAADERDYERALSLAGTADALRDEIGVPRTVAETTILERRLTTARKVLSDSATNAAAAAGRAMTSEQAITFARGG